MEDQAKRPQEEKDDYRPSAFSNVFQSFYEQFRGVPLRYFDIFIGLCMAALVNIIAVGDLQAKGIL